MGLSKKVEKDNQEEKEKGKVKERGEKKGEMFLHVSVASEVNVLRRRVRCFTFYNRGLIGTAIA